MNILNLIRTLDTKLQQPERLVLCGGMAVALAFGGKRQTFDLDVIGPLPLSAHLKSKAAEVAAEAGGSAGWLNDAAKGFCDYLPPGWSERLITVEMGLKKLLVQSLGKTDLIMMKLRAARDRDLADIEFLGIAPEDVRIIVANLDRISRFDPKAALHIRLQLEEWQLV
jgi:hypothetical protein